MLVIIIDARMLSILCWNMEVMLSFVKQTRLALYS